MITSESNARHIWIQEVTYDEYCHIATPTYGFAGGTFVQLTEILHLQNWIVI